MSKPKLTPHTHIAFTKRDVEATVGPNKYDILVPAGTLCKRLDAGDSPWVVEDLTFIKDNHSILYHDADHHGIRIPESELTDVLHTAAKG